VAEDRAIYNPPHCIQTVTLDTFRRNTPMKIDRTGIGAQFPLEKYYVRTVGKPAKIFELPFWHYVSLRY
jgi:hypothetical protein